MTEFSTSALLDVQVSQSSLSSARSTIEDELGDIEVDVAATVSDSTGGPGGSGGGLASSMLETTNTHLSEMRDQFDENIALNEERNTILREILDAQELTAQQDGGGNLLRTLGNATFGLIGGGLAIAAVIGNELANINWTGLVDDAIPNIEKGDIIDTTVAASDIIAEELPVEKSDVVDTTVTASDIIADDLPVGVSALVASGLPVAVSHLVSDGLPVTRSDLVGEGTPISATDIIEDPLPIGVGALVAATPLVELSNILGKGFPINVGDLIEQAQGESAPEESGDTSDNPDKVPGGNAIDLPEMLTVGGAAGGAFAILNQLSKVGPGTAGGSSPMVPAGLGPIPRDAFTDMVGEDNLSPFTIDGAGPDSDKATNREVIMGAIGADQAPILPGQMTAAPGVTQSGPTSSGVDQDAIYRAFQRQTGQTGTVTSPTGVELDGQGSGSGGSGSSRGTPDRQETNVTAEIINEIEMPLEFRNSREFQEFAKDPEGYIEDVINDKVNGGR